MRKTYLMLVALMLTMLGVSDAMAQKIYRAELDKSMFKAWNGTGADAQEVEPTSYVGKNDATVDFACESNFFKTLQQGAVVFGNTNVYSRWYANLTGTKKIYFKGDAGTAIRVLMNRPDAEPGAEDPNGGTSVEQRVEIGEDGTGSLDVSSMDYVHLNCVKIAWGSAGVIKSIELEGTVKPVTGILSMINNGDAEGDDVSSFPVSLDGPNNGDSAPDSPEIVEGGVSGKCFKVTAIEGPTETWHTQFYIKSDEVLPKGTKWKLSMAMKADQATTITTSAQAQPRQWKGSFVDQFGVTTEWKTYTWSGEIGVDDFQSIAFDLSNNNGAAGNGGVGFYFDNIEFGVDLGGSNPMNDISISHGYDVVCIDFNGMTNLKNLVAAAPGGGKTLFFDNSVASVTVDGQASEFVSVEARPDGNLYLFLLEDNVETEDVEVKVGFKNPTDDAHKILFTTGKFEGQEVPEFSGIVSTFDEKYGEGDYVSSLWQAPMLEKIEPEEGSFNLPADFKTFTVTFNQDIKASTVVAKLGAEPLTVAPAEGEAKTFTLTRTASTEIKGAVELIISKADGTHQNPLEDPIVVKYSYGPVATDGDDEPAILFSDNFGADDKNNYVPAGWVVNSDTEEREAGDYSGGCRVIVGGGGDNGFTKAILYACSRGASSEVDNPGHAYYGTLDGYKLTLTPRKYTFTADAARWDADGTERQLKIQICDEVTDEVFAEKTLAVEPNYKASKDATHFSMDFVIEETTNVVLKFFPQGTNGQPGGYGDACAIGNIKVEYIPDVMGIVETKALNDALDAAKTTYEDITNEDEEGRYAGEDLTALDNLIKEVEANKASYYKPSVYTAKAEELAAKAKAANDHKAACDTYDAAIKETLDLVAKFADTKFVSTQYYKDVVAKAEKYHGSRQEENLGDEENPIMEVSYSFDVLKDNANLATANTELADANLMASKWLTEGASDKGWGYITTGYAALHERIRRGVELLKSLGVADNDPLITWANGELGDADDIADCIVDRANKLILEDLAKGDDSKLFKAEFDEELGDFGETPSYDLSVFFKNPNCYGPAYSTEVPGWTSVQGNCFAWSSWDGAQNHSASTPYPEDCDIHAGWRPNPYAIVEQTVTNLPAGVYVVGVKCNDNGNSWATPEENENGSSTCVYLRTSENAPIESGATVDRDNDFATYLTASGDFEEVTVLDGELTVGFYYGNMSQAFFEAITAVKMVRPAEGYDYKKDKETSIETAAAPKVRALQVYDLNGRRMIKAYKGLQIVKKQMSDGSVRVEKVVVK